MTLSRRLVTSWTFSQKTRGPAQDPPLQVPWDRVQTAAERLLVAVLPVEPVSMRVCDDVCLIALEQFSF